jgi:hypothetical protein
VRACVLSCVRACVRACVLSCVRAFVRACVFACVRACVLALRARALVPAVAFGRLFPVLRFPHERNWYINQQPARKLAGYCVAACQHAPTGYWVFAVVAR